MADNVDGGVNDGVNGEKTKLELAASEKITPHVEPKDLVSLQDDVLDLPRTTPPPLKIVVDPSVEHSIGGGVMRINCASGWTFRSSIFEGRARFRCAGLPTSDPHYFSKRRRRFEFCVQGRFLRNVRIMDVVTGQEFEKPLKNIPLRPVVDMGINAVRRLSPGLIADVTGPHPSFVSPLAQVAQTISAYKDDEIASGDEVSSFMDPGEDFIYEGVRRRKAAMVHPPPDLMFQAGTLYTFSFYQDRFDPATYTLKLMGKNIGVARYLNSQPVQLMAKHVPSGEYLWRYFIDHDSLHA